MRRLLSFRFLLLLGWLALMPAVPAATAAENHAATAAENQAASAAENHAASSPSASPPPASPWEHSLSHHATPPMRPYGCEPARRPPNWLAREAQRPRGTAMPDPQEPQRTREEATRQSFRGHAGPDYVSNEKE